MIANLLKYMCAKNCRNRWSSDKAIAKIKRCSFLPHMVECGFVAYSPGERTTDAEWCYWRLILQQTLHGNTCCCCCCCCYGSIINDVINSPAQVIVRMHSGVSGVWTTTKFTSVELPGKSFLAFARTWEDGDAGRVANRRLQWILLRSLLCRPIRTFLYCRNC